MRSLRYRLLIAGLVLAMAVAGALLALLVHTQNQNQSLSVSVATLTQQKQSTGTASQWLSAFNAGDDGAAAALMAPVVTTGAGHLAGNGGYVTDTLQRLPAAAWLSLHPCSLGRPPILSAAGDKAQIVADPSGSRSNQRQQCNPGPQYLLVLTVNDAQIVRLIHISLNGRPVPRARGRRAPGSATHGARTTSSPSGVSRTRSGSVGGGRTVPPVTTLPTVHSVTALPAPPPPPSGGTSGSSGSGGGSGPTVTTSTGTAPAPASTTATVTAATSGPATSGPATSGSATATTTTSVSSFTVVTGAG